MNTGREESFDQYCARLARNRGDKLAAHMHELLHAYKSNESINGETATFFAEASQEFIRYQKGHPDAPAMDMRIALADAFELSVRKPGRRSLEGVALPKQFKLAWQVEVLNTMAVDRQGCSILVHEAIDLVATGMNQTYQVVKTARGEKMKDVEQEVANEISLFEDWAVPRRRSAEIAQRLWELAAVGIDHFEITLPPDLPQAGIVLRYPPSREVLSQMTIGHEAEGYHLVGVHAACSAKPQEAYKFTFEQLDSLELVALGEQVLKTVEEISKNDV